MWIIPDETNDKSRRSSQRKGWVSQDDVLDEETLTSRSDMDYYRIVSDRALLMSAFLTLNQLLIELIIK
jgi:hypothetical protein